MLLRYKNLWLLLTQELKMTSKTSGVQSFWGPLKHDHSQKILRGFKRVQVLKLKMFQEQLKNIHIESHMHNDLKTNTFKRRPACFCWSNEEKTCLSSRTGVRISPKVTISTWRWEGWETQRSFQLKFLVGRWNKPIWKILYIQLIYIIWPICRGESKKHIWNYHLVMNGELSRYP